MPEELWVDAVEERRHDAWNRLDQVAAFQGAGKQVSTASVGFIVRSHPDSDIVFYAYMLVFLYMKLSRSMSYE